MPEELKFTATSIATEAPGRTEALREPLASTEVVVSPRSSSESA